MNCLSRYFIVSIVLCLAGCTIAEPAGYISSGSGGGKTGASFVVTPLKDKYTYQGAFIRDSDFIARQVYPGGVELTVPNERVNVRIIENPATGTMNSLYPDGTYQFLSSGEKTIVVTYNGAQVRYKVEVFPPGAGGPPGIIITGP